MLYPVRIAADPSKPQTEIYDLSPILMRQDAGDSCESLDLKILSTLGPKISPELIDVESDRSGPASEITAVIIGPARRQNLQIISRALWNWSSWVNRALHMARTTLNSPSIAVNASMSFQYHLAKNREWSNLREKQGHENFLGCICKIHR